MSNGSFGDFSMALINQAEHDCAEQDPGMTDAAAMVLVGDVYALFVCHGDALSLAHTVAVPAAALAGEDELLPFIR